MSWSPSAALAFVGGGVLALAAAYALSEAADPVFPELRARVAHFRERSPAVEAVAVGNSHGAALEFAELGMDGMLFASAGQDAFEGAYVVRFALAEAPRLRTVFVAASYGVARTDHSVVGTRDLRVRRRQLYARMPLQRPLPDDLGTVVGGLLAPVVRDDHWKGVIGRPIWQRPPVRLQQDGRIGPSSPHPPGPDSLARYGPRVALHHTRFGAETMMLAPDTPDRVARVLDALARELRARDIELVLFTPPYHESYLRAQDPLVNAETRAVMERIVAENPNAVWLDYSTDGRFRARHELFNNSDHLNRAGGRAFSRLLRECLSGAHEEDGPAPWVPGCPKS